MVRSRLHRFHARHDSRPGTYLDVCNEGRVCRCRNRGLRMPSIGARCHELRIVDRDQNWRVVYRIEVDAVLILSVFAKKTAATPKEVIESCQARIKRYEQAIGGRR